MELYSLTINEVSELLKKREISATDLVTKSLDRIDKVEENIKAFITITREDAFKKASEVDAKIKAGEAISPLTGIPMALKDNMCTDGIRTTCASKMLHNFVPPFSATVYEKLNKENAILLGKLNMDEFAMGSTTENSAFFSTKNPWDLSCVPGGSSGGSAAAVAADEAFFSLGSDTGGSIRQPASFCGVVGLKPTYGAVSRYGVVAFASSLDQVGTFTKDVTDSALVMNAISGYDKKDSTSANIEYPDYTSFLQNDVKGMKIGIPKEYYGEGIAPEIEANIKEAIKKLEELGAIVEECSLPHTEYALPTYHIIAPAECSSNMARFDGVRYGLRVEADNLVDMFCETRKEGLCDEVKRRIMLGTYALSAGSYDAYYLKALKVRALIKQDFDKAFEKYDCLLTPTTPNVSFKLGSNMDALSLYKLDVCTMPINLAGVPALSIPFGLANNRPVGLQLIGQAFGEGKLLQVAYTLEQNTDKTRMKPNLQEVK
ncbi:aspartyl/glutamyl-tRNA(Asn/Gln) amidotransferase subunit A [Desulfonispora thiosulfatigenes DSM 11270]|uniref:Glutamyl-tRNA(Gln) amidotransferase subunit A n=1 Tax=Desulfonispora thiosulfatigenes DSM 11270 TaxID=656914 RepID=A0A1W1UGE5_DESTI|nr:Asp-tRNA(Asn)/Glu-tRNA(Gln) amidotransferase subunit GatA [Desulfonispora thiosulfatigenes]SMB80140.1 aspartyl/glutamyl-tRNA(Asn/Gln) amidotransferase subunit A [Desulfonispora thiosulfatigenes DSM 11270]